MPNGSISLQEVAGLTANLEVACSRCERRGRYATARLLAAYGPEYSMTDLGLDLANCPNRLAPIYQRCDVYYPGLTELMYGPPKTKDSI